MLSFSPSHNSLSSFPVFSTVFLPLIGLFYFVRTRYNVAARECKRWEAVSRSPVYAFFTQSIKGLPTIRAYGEGEVSCRQTGLPTVSSFLGSMEKRDCRSAPPRPCECCLLQCLYIKAEA
jgi:hypothetical protein